MNRSNQTFFLKSPKVRKILLFCTFQTGLYNKCIYQKEKTAVFRGHCINFVYRFQLSHPRQLPVLLFQENETIEDTMVPFFA